MGSKRHIFSATECGLAVQGHSRSSKVNDFGTNRKRIYDFLLVINSNFGLNDTSSSKCPNKKIGTLFTTFNHYTESPTLSSQTPHLLNHRRWCHRAKIKTNKKQVNLQNFFVWNSHCQHAARLFHTMPYDWLFLSIS